MATSILSLSTWLATEVCGCKSSIKPGLSGYFIGGSCFNPLANPLKNFKSSCISLFDSRKKQHSHYKYYFPSIKTAVNFTHQIVVKSGIESRFPFYKTAISRALLPSKLVCLNFSILPLMDPRIMRPLRQKISLSLESFSTATVDYSCSHVIEWTYPSKRNSHTTYST